MSGANANTSADQEIKQTNLIGAVLAGGGSVRMGRPKHALVLDDGRTMLEHVVAALREVCSDVVVLGSIDAAGGLRYIEDHRPGAGPLAGVESLLMNAVAHWDAAPMESSTKGRVHEAQQFVICPCDVPLVTGELLRQLVLENDKPATVFRVQGRERFEALPMRVSADAIGELQQYLDAGGRSVQGFIETAGYAEVVIDENAAQQLCNINTPVDLAAIHRD